ncbi:hypothetical protein ACIQU6_09675 [Streptomyces sp. NPDC090442]|uniref:hypothetical protein n=1 Tax=Streptomyces sp. NPDC090442 TaxID=3365962 RepID=UPI003800360B
MSIVIDLDAQRREVQYPHGIPVLLRDEEFLFPAELPAKALDPLLSDDLDLVGLLRDIVDAADNPTAATVVELLLKRPRLPRKFVHAIYEIHTILLGPQEYERLEALNPSLADYVRLTVSLAKVYGVDMGKLFRLGGSSESDGEMSSPTSAASTGSTPGGSGESQESPATSG